MGKTRKKEVEIEMPRYVCTDVRTDAGVTELQKSVERIIKRNKKVFDNLAKS